MRNTDVPSGTYPPPNSAARDSMPIPYDMHPYHRKIVVDFCLNTVIWSKAKMHLKLAASRLTKDIKAGAISWKEYGKKLLVILSSLVRAGVITLDFRSLYPSIYIADNICYSTEISVEEARYMGYVEDVDYHPYYDLEFIDEKGELHYHTTPDPVCFLDPKVLVGVFSVMESELSDERAAVKREMKKVEMEIEERKMELKKDHMKTIERLKSLELLPEPDGGWGKGESPQEKMDEFVKNVLNPLYAKDLKLLALMVHQKMLDLRQNAIKTYMNSMYGYPGAEDSPLPNSNMATTITGGGRCMLDYSKWLAENKFTSPAYPFVTLVVYGDTDSNFAALIGLEPRKDVLKAVGFLMAEYITKFFKEPKALLFEKVYLNMIIGANKKMYAGRKVVVGVAEDVLEVKGMKFKKRGSSEFEKMVMKNALYHLVMSGDSEACEAYVKHQLHLLVTGKIPTYMLVMSGALGKKIKDYPSMRPVLEVAIKYEDPLNPHTEGDRVEYVYVKGPPNCKSISDMAEDPDVAIAKGLPINYSQYASILVAQLEVVFGPVFGGDLQEVQRVFLKGKHMDYSVDPFIFGAQDMSTYRELPIGSKVNYITSYMKRRDNVCVVCNAEVDMTCDKDAVAVEKTGVIVHSECSRLKCRVCGKQKASKLMKDYITCISCGEDPVVMGEFSKMLPWDAKKTNKSLALTSFDMASSLKGFVEEAVTCVKQCMKCVGEGNEIRIDTCNAKSCKWWRRGNHAAVSINNTIHKMETYGVMNYLKSKIPSKKRTMEQPADDNKVHKKARTIEISYTK